MRRPGDSPQRDNEVATQWLNIQPQGELAEPGNYRVMLTVNGTDYIGSVTIREDPMLSEYSEPIR